jgi:hypothetical protein
VQTIWDEGFLWTAESDKHSEPYYIYKGLVRLPITADDWPLHEGNLTSTEWVQKFSKLMKSRAYIAFGLHDFVASFNPEEILQAWERILQIAVESRVPLVNFSEAADLYRRASMSKYLSKNNQSDTNKQCLEHNYEKIVTKEMMKLNNNIIAIICYWYEEMPLFIKEIAKRNRYLIIESNKFLDDESIRCFILNKEEILEPKLQWNSVDLIICTSNIEYLFQPDHLADCIKKLGKIGATYIVNFQNTGANIESLDKSMFEMTKHHISPVEIKRWSNQIGRGNLFIIDTNFPDHNENRNSKGDKSSEQIKISGKYLKGCTLIGKVQYIDGIKQNKRLHSLSEVMFHFPSPNLEHYRIILEEKKVFFMRPIKKAVRMFQNLK